MAEYTSRMILNLLLQILAKQLETALLLVLPAVKERISGRRSVPCQVHTLIIIIIIMLPIKP
jgi:hypothetical protein